MLTKSCALSHVFATQRTYRSDGRPLGQQRQATTTGQYRPSPAKIHGDWSNWHPYCRKIAKTGKSEQVTAMGKTNRPFLSTQDLASLLGVTRQTIRNWIKGGHVRAYHIGQNLKIPVEEAQRILRHYALPIPDWLEARQTPASRASGKREQPMARGCWHG
jgi:excisionase family DNA binding protein